MNKKRFGEILDWLQTLPGRIEIGTSTDTKDRYIAWYPDTANPSYLQFWFGGCGNNSSPYSGGEVEIELRIKTIADLNERKEPA